MVFEAIAMTRRMLGLMWRSHDSGYIHGDFHESNGAFKENMADGSEQEQRVGRRDDFFRVKAR